MHASHNPTWYSEQAAEARLLAKGAATDELRTIYENVAGQYEQLAVVTGRRLRVAVR